MKKLSIKDEQTDFLLYTAPDGKVKVEVFLNEETVWLSQKTIATLFGVQVPAISKHLDNIYESGELTREATISILETVQIEGNREVKRNIEYYNLDAIISVGYRVNSRQATQFRIWATNTLKEYIIKGFILDDERLKNGRYFGKDYFRELLERVRSIRASERRIYQQITDIFAECSIDYDPKSDITQEFLCFGAKQISFCHTRTNCSRNNIPQCRCTKGIYGFTNMEKCTRRQNFKSDSNVAKNYLNEEEIKSLERTVGGFFDYIERIIETRNTFTMEQFSLSVNKFLEFNEYKVLESKGTISAKQAEEKAFAEYDKFNKTQKIESDFDKAVKALQTKNKSTKKHDRP